MGPFFTSEQGIQDIISIKYHFISMDSLMLIHEASSLLGDAIVNIRQDSSLAKENCLQSLSLLQFAANISIYYVATFDVICSSLKLLIQDISEKASAKQVNASSMPPSSLSIADVTSTGIAHVSFQNIIGNIDAKQLLFENVVLPMILPVQCKVRIFRGIRGGCSNVLLYGPPGTGKTLLVQAVSAEAGATLFSIRPSDILSKFQGESERFIRDLFASARRNTGTSGTKSIIFFDEFDSIALSRGSSGEDTQNSRRILAELLLQLTCEKQRQKLIEQENGCMSYSSASGGEVTPASLPYTSESSTMKWTDIVVSNCHSDIMLDGGEEGKIMPPSAVGASQTHTSDQSNSTNNACDVTATSASPNAVAQPCMVVVIAATNRIEDIDEAVLRRFECKVQVGVPDLDTRATMVGGYSNSCSGGNIQYMCGDDIDLGEGMHTLAHTPPPHDTSEHYFLQGVEHSLSREDVRWIAEKTEGWSGSELENLCREAAMIPIRSLYPMMSLSLRAGNRPAKEQDIQCMEHKIYGTVHDSTSTSTGAVLCGRDVKALQTFTVPPITVKHFEMVFASLCNS